MEPKDARRFNVCCWKVIEVFIIVCCVRIESTFANEGFVNLGQEPLNVKPANWKSEKIIAIATTWKGLSEGFANSWLRYHIAIGFSRIYLFFDDPIFDKALIEYLSKADEYKHFLTIVKVGKEHRKRFWTIDENNHHDPEQLLLPRFGVFLEKDIMARQQLNVARAGVLAKADGVNWLLHLDADELFWVERLKSGVVRSFFEQLHNRKITHLTMLNDEIIPLTADFAYKKRSQDPFHQRMHFKRNRMALERNEEQELVQKYVDSRNTAYFLGYMCGKGGINVELWRKNMGEDMPILPQNVVAFAFDSYQPGNLTLINKDASKVLPYISSKKLKVAVSTSVARVLHYFNWDFDTCKTKFTRSKYFKENYYDSKFLTKEEKDKFRKWEKYWTPPEAMPSAEFFREMYSKVRKTMETKDDKYALDFYIKSAVAPPKKVLPTYLSKGVIYKNNEAYQFLAQIEKILSKHKKGRDKLFLEMSAGKKFVDGGNGIKNENRSYAFYPCEHKGPHFICDVKHCCDFITKPQFTFTKRLLGYIRYDKMQWWRPGIKWPQ